MAGNARSGKGLDCRTLTVNEAAELLGIGKNAAYEAAKRGDIPSLRIGRRVVVPREALEELLRRAYTGNGTEVGDSPGALDTVRLPAVSAGKLNGKN